MARLEAKRLRDLVNDYYHGLITFESYREQRAELLDNIGHLAEKADDTATTAVDRKPRPKIAAEASETGPAGKSRIRLIIGIVVAIVAAVAAFVMLGTPDGRRGSATPEIRESATPGDPGSVIVTEFLDRNDWSQESIANLLLAWNALDDAQRARAMENRAYRRLTTSLHQRIREEAALNPTPTPRFRSMTSFAENLGAPYRLAGSTVVDDFGTPQPQPVPAETVEYDDEAFEEEPNPGSPTESSDDKTSNSAPSAVVEAQLTADTAASTQDSRSEPEKDLAPIDDACPASLANTRRPYCHDALAVGGEGPMLVVISAGSFDMGSEAKSDESPVHHVTIGTPFAMSQYEVSVAEFGRYCKIARRPCPENPWGAEDYPVVNVSWDDAIGYVQWLSEQSGHAYRLPTEAEWEYAVRAGTTTPYFFGDEVTPSSARSSANGPNDGPLPSSERRVNRNPFRLYHMSGNVREWTLDAWYPDYRGAGPDGSARVNDTETGRVVRGGSYADPGDRLRSAARESLGRSRRDTVTGFRVVREIAVPRD